MKLADRIRENKSSFIGFTASLVALIASVIFVLLSGAIPILTLTPLAVLAAVASYRFWRN